MKFTPSHEWIVIQEDMGTVGITAYARSELGDVVYVELPSIAKQVSAGQEVAVLESTKAAADIYSPVSGEIIAVNEGLSQDVRSINQAPETEGWLFKIRLSKPCEIDQLLDCRPEKSS